MRPFALALLLVIPAAVQQPEIAATLAFTEGPTVDRDGNVYFTDVVNERITNNAFGGPDMKTLYVTAGKTLYKLRMDIAGLPR